MNYVESDLIICALLWLLFHVLSVFAPRRFKLSMRTKRTKAKKTKNNNKTTKQNNNNKTTKQKTKQNKKEEKREKKKRGRGTV